MSPFRNFNVSFNCMLLFGSQNDPGVDGHFSTFIKARIFCNKKVPVTREFNGALDYQYSSIDSLVFNDNGRFHENGDWSKKMYGAFSGPL